MEGYNGTPRRYKPAMSERTSQNEFLKYSLDKKNVLF